MSGGGGEAGQGQGIVEQGAGPLPHRLQTGRAEVIAGAGAVVGDDPGARLQEGLHAPRGPAGDVSRVAAMGLGQEVGDDAGIAMGPRRQDEGLFAELHQSPLTASTTASDRSLGMANDRTYCSIFQPSSVRRRTPEPRVGP